MPTARCFEPMVAEGERFKLTMAGEYRANNRVYLYSGRAENLRGRKRGERRERILFIPAGGRTRRTNGGEGK